MNYKSLLDNLKKKCVYNYAEGREAWHNTVGAFFLSKKGISGSILLSLITMSSSPFWWPKKLLQATITIEQIVIVLGILLSVAFATGLIYLKHRTSRSLNIKYMLHQFVHDIRDYHTKIFRHLKDIHNSKNKDFSQEYKEHLLLIANHTKDFFRTLLKDDSIETAIRLAFPSKKEKGNVEYITRIRTSGLNKNREETSEPIPANKGIPRYLIERKCQEILIYEDIAEAIRLGLFFETANERNFPEEIKSMMVCPLNAWDGSKKSMIGILFITSRENDIFKEKNVDSARFVSDAAANSISFASMMYKLINSYKKRGK